MLIPMPRSEGRHNKKVSGTLPSWVKNRCGDTPLGNTSTIPRCTLMIMSPNRYNSQFSLRHWPFNLNRESPYRYTTHFSLRHLPFNKNREEVVIVGANPSQLLIQSLSMQTHSTSRVLDEIDSVCSLRRLYAVTGKIVSTIRRETVTTTRHRNAKTPEAHRGRRAAEPVIQHAYTPEESLILEINEKFPVIGIALSQIES